jgi:predicted Zn-dependent peptidase
MVLVVVGDFEPENILEEIKKRLLQKESRGEIQRIYPEDKEEINKKEIKVQMEVSQPLFMIGIKDNPNTDSENIVKKHIAIEIILNMLVGKSSKLYARLYEQGLLLEEPSIDYEFSKQYAHVLIATQSKNPQKVYEEILKEIENMKKQTLNQEDFNRTKRKIYGSYVAEYNNVADIGRMFVSDYIKGINSFEYIEQFEQVDEKYVKEILNKIFKEEKTIISIVEPK